MTPKTRSDVPNTPATAKDQSRTRNPVKSFLRHLGVILSPVGPATETQQGMHRHLPAGW